jgi:tetratricopeptide (TPR) repeat protein
MRGRAEVLRGRGALGGLALALLFSTGCAGQRASAAAPGEDPLGPTSLGDSSLADGDATRAASEYTRAARAGDAEAWLKAAAAREALHDWEGATGAYDSFLALSPAGEAKVTALARRGALEAEMQNWEASSGSFAQAFAALPSSALPSLQVELLARRGMALFQLERFEDAERVMASADEIYEDALANEVERFPTHYFAGMARFYRAAIIHRRFREQEVRLPEAQMAKDLDAKLALVELAQAAYNDAIRVKHMFWVSAAGYQLGTLYEEFYDALMHAPVPEWLDDEQRQVYFEELKGRLRPVVNKAIWVFEKNVESARRLGVSNEFIDRTEARMARLQSILLAGEPGLGRPHARLVPEAAAEDPTDVAEQPRFLPTPTPL